MLLVRLQPRLARYSHPLHMQVQLIELSSMGNMQARDFSCHAAALLNSLFTLDDCSPAAEALLPGSADFDVDTLR